MTSLTKLSSGEGGTGVPHSAICFLSLLYVLCRQRKMCNHRIVTSRRTSAGSDRKSAGSRAPVLLFATRCRHKLDHREVGRWEDTPFERAFRTIVSHHFLVGVVLRHRASQSERRLVRYRAQYGATLSVSAHSEQGGGRCHAGQRTVPHTLRVRYDRYFRLFWEEDVYRIKFQLVNEKNKSTRK